MINLLRCRFSTGSSSIKSSVREINLLWKNRTYKNILAQVGLPGPDKIKNKGNYFQKRLHLVSSARCNIYISRLCYDVSVRLSVRLSVTEVH